MEVYNYSSQCSFKISASLKLIGLVALGFLGTNLSVVAKDSDITLTDASTAPVAAGSFNQEIVMVEVAHQGGGPGHNTNVTAMNFTAVNTLNSDVDRAILYYTTTAVFGTGTPLGAPDVNVADGITFSGFSQGIARGASGFFWLAYDISSSATTCTNTVDATQVIGDITVDEGVIVSYTDNATGNRQIEPAASPTTLVAGDIAMVGMNATDPDEFTFVLLVDINGGTVINFTDKGWLAASGFRTGEGTVVWTAAGCDANTCGTEITIENGSPWTSTSGSVTTNGTFALAMAGDQILAYTGTEASPTHIAALDNSGTIGWDADAIDAQTSALPTGLTEGTTCVSTTPDVNVVYNCSTTSGGATAIRPAVNTAANWTGSGTTITLPVPCSFSCGCGTPATAPAAPTYASITTTSFDINWSSGGPNYLVVVKSGSAVTSTPVDNTTYTANTVFGSGSDIGTLEYVVYNGTGTTVSVTGLTCGTTYHVEVFSHDCVAGSEKYKIDVGGVSNQATSACPGATCFDNTLNGTETGIDCGGSCPLCDCE